MSTLWIFFCSRRTTNIYILWNWNLNVFQKISYELWLVFAWLLYGLYYTVTRRGPLQCSGLLLILHTYLYPYPSQPAPHVNPFSSLLIPNVSHYYILFSHYTADTQSTNCWGTVNYSISNAAYCTDTLTLLMSPYLAKSTAAKAFEHYQESLSCKPTIFIVLKPHTPWCLVSNLVRLDFIGHDSYKLKV